MCLKQTTTTTNKQTKTTQNRYERLLSLIQNRMRHECNECSIATEKRSVKKKSEDVKLWSALITKIAFRVFADNPPFVQKNAGRMPGTSAYQRFTAAGMLKLNVCVCDSQTISSIKTDCWVVVAWLPDDRNCF